MHSHFRRLTSAEVTALNEPSEYRAFASFGGYCVGKSGGDYIVHVTGKAHSDLPGKHEADSYEALHSAVRKNVLEARWRELDANGEVVIVRGKIADMPKDAIDPLTEQPLEPVETDLIPHRFV